MSATILPFPARVAKVIPISAARNACDSDRDFPILPILDVKARAIATLNNLYEGALAGSPVYRAGLELAARSAGEPILADMAADLLAGLPPVMAPCECEPSGGDAA